MKRMLGCGPEEQTAEDNFESLLCDIIDRGETCDAFLWHIAKSTKRGFNDIALSSFKRAVINKDAAAALSTFERLKSHVRASVIRAAKSALNVKITTRRVRAVADMLKNPVNTLRLKDCLKFNTEIDPTAIEELDDLGPTPKFSEVRGFLLRLPADVQDSVGALADEGNEKYKGQEENPKDRANLNPHDVQNVVNVFRTLIELGRRRQIEGASSDAKNTAEEIPGVPAGPKMQREDETSQEDAD